MVFFLFSPASLLVLSGKNATASRKHFGGITFSLTCLAYAAIVTGADSPVVQLGRTSISGISIDNDLDYFAGIPYAEAPVGTLRFEHPVLKLRLDVDRFDATKRGPSCLSTWGDPNSMAEDCLTIDILRPAGSSPGSNLPVAVWFYGGGFSGGDNGPYGGNVLVRDSIARRTPIIYVTFNYRMNAFGFLCGQVGADNGASNVGLLDQKAALEWVRANINLFGGDPSKVTPMGQSAGAVSLGIHALNGGLEGLVSGAIFQSGVAGVLPIYHPSRYQKCWEALVAGVPKCATSKQPFQCLKSADANAVLESARAAVWTMPGGYAFVPTLDNNTLPNLPSQMNLDNTFSRIPCLLGHTEDEGTVFVSAGDFAGPFRDDYSPSPAGSAALESLISQIPQHYPNIPSLGSPFGTGNDTFGEPPEKKRNAALYGDAHFVAPLRDLVQTLAQSGRTSYVYVLNDPGLRDGKDGVRHGADIAPLFGFSGGPPPIENLAAKMRDFWLSFITSHDPNDGKGTQRPRWAAYTKENPVVMQLNSQNLGVVSDKEREGPIAFLIKNAFVMSR